MERPNHDINLRKRAKNILDDPSMWDSWLGEFRSAQGNQSANLELFLEAKIAETLGQYLRDDSGEQLPKIGLLLEEADIKNLIARYVNGWQRILSDNSGREDHKKWRIRHNLRILLSAALTSILLIGIESCMTPEKVRGEIYHRVIKVEDWKSTE